MPLLPVQEVITSIPIEEGLFPTPPPPTLVNEPVFIDSFVNGQHQVRGDVYALDERTLMIEGFNYDGTAPGECCLVYT